MAEKKQNIQDGKNIELDGITVINEGISLAEKEEVKEAAKEETSEAEIEITPDVKIETPEETASQEATVADPAQSQEEVPAPIAIDIDPVVVDPVPAELEPAPQPEVSDAPISVEPSVQEEVPAYDIGVHSDNPFQLGGYNEIVVDNRPQVPTIPENVINAFDVAKNEVAEIYMKNQELTEKMNGYEDAIAEKDRKILDKDRQINELTTKVSNYEAKLKLVRNKVLDEFGLGGMAVEEKPAQAPVANAPYADDGVTINNDISLAA